MSCKINIINWKTASLSVRENILNRCQLYLKDLEPEVKKWIRCVKEKGDIGIREYINEFDKLDKDISLNVHKNEIERSFERINKDLLEKITEQIKISKSFHAAYMTSITKEFSVEHYPGVRAGYKRIPVDSAGLYVPAGKAPLPTVAQILTVAAKTAGVPRVVVCFPPTTEAAEDVIVVAATLAGANEIYRVGGIAAIAALAYGTESIQPVHKIVGPGSPWVQTAKLQVVDKVGIDMFSGPSEAVILADETSNPVFLAADILARCEHGPDSAGVLITTSSLIAEKTAEEIDRQKVTLNRRKYIDEALIRFSVIIVVDSIKEMIDLTNQYMPEHLEIQTSFPSDIFKQIRHAGSTFLGPYAPVSVGDYASGTNHCLPTGFATGYSSPVSPETFLKTLQFQELTAEGLKKLLPIVEVISDAEGLDGHKRSVQLRFEAKDLTKIVV